MTTPFEASLQSVPRPRKTSAAGDSFWRKGDPTLGKERRVTCGGMFEHQRMWWSLPNFIRVIVGGYGSGKTMVLCKRAIAMALHNAPSPYALVSPTYAMARETTIRTVRELCQGKRTIYGRGFWWRYNATSHTFTIRYRGREGRIIIYSSENPDSLRGPNLGGAGIDEPFIQPEVAFNQMIARVRDPAARVHEISCAGTPEQLNWGYDLCEGELSERHDVGFIQASTRLNLTLPPGYVPHLEGAYADKEASAYIEGHFVNLAKGAVYYAFDPDDQMVDISRPAGSELGVGMDFNVNPMACVVFWRRGDHMHVFDEFEFPNADTEYVCQELRDRYWEEGLREVYPDASGRARHTNAPGGRSDFSFIEDAGFTVNAPHQNPARRDRYNAVNGKLKSRDGRVTLTISPKCKKLKKYLSVYSHELMNKAEQKKMSHELDALGYPIAYLWPVTKDRIDVVRFGGY